VSKVKAVFPHLDTLVEGIHALQKAGVTDMVVSSPLPRHDIEEVMYKGEPSPVRWWTLTGALLGGSGGFALASFSSAVWPMTLPGGKPVVSVPPFMVITFESAVLIGALFTLLGLLYHCRLPMMKVDFELEDPRYTLDCFGILARGLSPAKREEVAGLLWAAGATEVSDDSAGAAKEA